MVGRERERERDRIEIREYEKREEKQKGGRRESAIEEVLGDRRETKKLEVGTEHW